jgi:hypothetical protein
MRRARRTASEITAVCDLVGARLSLGSYHSLPGGTVEEASGARRTAPEISPEIHADLLRLSPRSRTGSCRRRSRLGRLFRDGRIRLLSVARRGSRGYAAIAFGANVYDEPTGLHDWGTRALRGPAVPISADRNKS